MLGRRDDDRPRGHGPLMYPRAGHGPPRPMGRCIRLPSPPPITPTQAPTAGIHLSRPQAPSPNPAGYTHSIHKINGPAPAPQIHIPQLTPPTPPACCIPPPSPPKTTNTPRHRPSVRAACAESAATVGRVDTHTRPAIADADRGRRSSRPNNIQHKHPSLYPSLSDAVFRSLAHHFCQSFDRASNTPANHRLAVLKAKECISLALFVKPIPRQRLTSVQ